MESIATVIVEIPTVPSAKTYTNPILFALRVNEIAFPALLMLGVVATKPGPAIVTRAGDVPAGNWILATGVILIVLGKL
jgi:hypothetical protein